jgi:cytochrome P450
VRLSSVVEFGAWATRVTLDIIGLAGMGRDFNAIHNSDDELARDYESLLEPSTRRGIYFALNLFGPQDLIQALPFSQTIELRRITTNLKKFCREHVQQKRLRSHDTKESDDMDILSLLIRSNDFSDEDLVDQLLTFLAAGHETTSSTLTWAIHLLAKNQDWQSRLREEVRSKLPPLASSSVPLASEIEALPILNAICNEMLRLYPVVPISLRTATKDTTISVSGSPQHVPAESVSPFPLNGENFLGLAQNICSSLTLRRPFFSQPCFLKIKY